VIKQRAIVFDENDFFADADDLPSKLARKIKRNKNERFENDLAMQIRAHKMPEPERQYRFAEPRKFAADFAWPGLRVLIEVQGGIWMPGGGAHSRPMNIERDVEKLQLAAIYGWTLVPVTTKQVKNGEAIAVLERVLAVRGWRR
jgi:very-short-patch-repair endonuclease